MSASKLCCYTVVSPSELKSAYPGKFYRLTNLSECHRGLTYKTGLNIDPIPFNPKDWCSSGGMYFFHESQLYTYTWATCEAKNLRWLREVTFPADAQIYVEPGKFKADKFILSEREVVPEWIYIRSVAFNGLTIGFIPTECLTTQICATAVAEDVDALQYIPQKMKTRKMFLEAAKKCEEVIPIVPKSMKTPTFYLQAYWNHIYTPAVLLCVALVIKYLVW